ncbi:dephospho-CoA kinase [Aestuariimicrobium soli]|uniref:dephospho-CoA kinase n=1 Tax=Aestuariimicrobium soli TaxID=2035834 RepID=UPI003EB780A5
MMPSRDRTRRTTIGLTGGIASGKSTVAERLVELGAVVIDSDELAREAVAPGSEGLAGVVELFGRGVLAADGSLDRAALGRRVFADDHARRRLEGVVHPRVRALSRERIAAAPAGAVVVEMIPLLIETGQAARFDELLVVDLPRELQRDRLVRRSGLSEAEAEARIDAQASRAERLAAATHVFDNSGDREHLLRQVDQWWTSAGHRTG